jgi:hypothetical protein
MFTMLTFPGLTLALRLYRMSGSGHFQTSALVTAMSAFPPIATELRTSLEVRFVPDSEMALPSFPLDDRG